MMYGYVKVGENNLTLYMRIAFDNLIKNNKIKIKAYGKNISKAIYLTHLLKDKFNGEIDHINTGIENNVSVFTADITCDYIKIRQSFKEVFINKCKKCNNEIKTNDMYKSINLYCPNCIKKA